MFPYDWVNFYNQSLISVMVWTASISLFFYFSMLYMFPNHLLNFFLRKIVTTRVITMYWFVDLINGCRGIIIQHHTRILRIACHILLHITLRYLDWKHKPLLCLFALWWYVLLLLLASVFTSPIIPPSLWLFSPLPLFRLILSFALLHLFSRTLEWWDSDWPGLCLFCCCQSTELILVCSCFINFQFYPSSPPGRQDTITAPPQLVGGCGMGVFCSADKIVNFYSSIH